MIDVRERLSRIRVGIVTARTVEWLVRWSFYGLLALCLYVLAVKFLELPVPGVLPVVAAAVPLIAAVRALSRRPSLRDCAVLVDRRFRLDERVSSALEIAGPFQGALALDASRAMDRADARSIGRLRWPRETPFLAITGLVALTLWAIPAPERAAKRDPRLLAVAREERSRILSAEVLTRRDLPAEIRAMASEAESIAALLERGTPEATREALARLRKLEEAASERSMSASLSEGERRLLDDLAARAAGSGAGLARALEAAGDSPKDGNPTPRSVVKKLGAPGTVGGTHASDRPSEFVVRESSSGGTSAVEARETVRRALERRDWPARYDEAVRNYFSDP